MFLTTKEELVLKIKALKEAGWHKSVKKTIITRNDGAVGNTLEQLLGIRENNLPIPNAREWELKGQRKNSSSLITLKHIEPSPRAAKIVSQLLLPYYGWKHPLAGSRYPESEMSFRSTTSGDRFTRRGFRIIVDRSIGKLRFVFDPTKADTNNSEISEWLEAVSRRIGLGPLNPEPYWGFEDLKYEIGEKVKNCFFVIADTKIENNHEYFKYEHLFILSAFSFDKFLSSVEKGFILVDFDARTGHNHGTKFRVRPNHWVDLYDSVETIF
ncbi:MAG: MvaI/BcnI family restriction endonuclease [Candidatus Saccharicenans sp.]|jgi:hypothetical protein|nr:MvaI/BcnI family restriction endonuclease [Candidatus Saccharicenans sp.]MDH7574617.1 MvaI/BcnI family restriction endonuclease [Candidatus Saccharicenans sp.]